MKIIVSSKALKKTLQQAIEKVPRSIYTFKIEDGILHIHCFQLPVEPIAKESFERWFTRKQLNKLVTVLMLLEEQPITLSFQDNNWITITHASI